jgi:signal peptidase II
MGWNDPVRNSDKYQYACSTNLHRNGKKLKEDILTNLDSPNENPKNNQSTHDENISVKPKKISSLPSLFIGAGILIALDQWTKSLVVENIPYLGIWLPNQLAHWGTIFRIVHWRNSGAAFGMFSNGNTLFLILAVIASIFIVAFYPLIERNEWPLRLAMTLQLGGAIGNMIDRIRYGYVIDFISIRDFPVFNVADSCISLGVAILLLGVILQEIKTQKAKNHSTDQIVAETPRREEAE